MNGARLTANFFTLAGFAVSMAALLIGAVFSLLLSNKWLAAAGIIAFGYGMFFLAFMLKSYVDGALKDSREPNGYQTQDNRKMRDGMYQ